jgi:hypothetical protein
LLAGNSGFQFYDLALKLNYSHFKLFDCFRLPLN